MAHLSIKRLAAVAAAALALGAAVTATSVTASAASSALVEWDGTAAEGFAGGTGTEADPYLISNAQELAYFVSVTGYRADNEGDYFKLTSDILLNDSFDDSPNVWKNEDMFEGVFDGDGHTIYGLYQISANESGVIGSLTETGVIKNLNVADAYIAKAIGSAGIICGSNAGTISNCTTSGYVHSYTSYVGGICSSASVTGVVENCVNYATVECNDIKAGGITGAVRLGGAVRNCYNAGDVSGTHSSSYQIGGICGYLEAGSVTGCGNIGNVSNLGRGSGGVVGMMYDSCTVTNCYNTGDISAADDVGGVWGYMNNTEHSVSYCYNAGDVVATDSTASREYQIGNFIDGCVSNVYYDSSVCTAAYSTNTPYAKTTAQLTTSAVITNLGFDSSVWSKTANTSTFLRYPNLSAISVDDPKTRTGTAVDISTATISAIQDQGYAAVALTPEVIVTRGVERLVEGRDYTVAYSSNTNIGTATVKLTGTGDYTGTKSATFKIVAKPAGGLVVPEITGQVFTGSELKPTFKVYNGTKLLTSGTDYTYTYSNNINAGNGTITLTGKGSYTGTKTVKFEIERKDISLLTFPAIPDQYYDFGNTIWPDITLKDGSYVLKKSTDYSYQGVAGGNNTKIGAAAFKVYGRGNYDGSVELNFNIVPIPADQFVVSDIAVQLYTGSAITPSFTVKGGGRRLTEGTHYTVAYSNNINVGTATITLTGLDYFTGTKKVTFAIKKDLTATTVSSIADQAYTGSAITPAVTVKDGSTTLTKGTHYTVAYSNNTNAGTATVTITGKGDYTGTKTVTFKIVKSISNATVSAIPDQAYKGSEIKPAVTVKDGSTTLTNGTDYTVAYSNNISVGTATVTITGKGNYTGTKTVTFRILRSLSNAMFSAIYTQTYTGSAITPDVTVRFGSTVLTLNTDYTVAFSNNINVGTATVTATGMGNYTGTTTATFLISAKSLLYTTISAIADQPYTGSEITPALTVKDGSRTLISGTDYTAEYSKNTALGTATVWITGTGNYKDKNSAKFQIVARPVSDLTVSAIADQTYTGSAIEPSVTVKNGSTTLVSGTDYTVAYSDNINAGTATITITGKGNYTGTKTVTFKINGISISGATVSAIADQTYTGAAITPAVTVKDGSTELVSGTDYTIAYSNNTNVGTANVTITGKGNYSGTKTVTFKIVSPSPAANFKAVAGEGKVTLTWDAVTGATKYKLRRNDGNGWKDYKVLTATSFTDTSVVSGTTYRYVVYAYAGGVYGGASAIVSATPKAAAVAAPTGVKATSDSGKITVTWTAVSGATKYKVRRHDGTGWSDLKVVSTTSYTDTAVTVGTTYKYAVYAYANKWSGASAIVSAAPKAAAPANVKATAGSEKITVTWSAVSGATKYKVRRHDGTGWSDLKVVSTTSYTDTAVTVGTTYKYAVYAYVNGKYGAASETVSAVPKTAAPANVKAAATSGKITVTWTAVSGATKYKVRRHDGTGWADYKTVSATSLTDTSVTAGKTYKYAVYAYVNGAWGGASAIVSATAK